MCGKMTPRMRRQGYTRQVERTTLPGTTLTAENVLGVGHWYWENHRPGNRNISSYRGFSRPLSPTRLPGLCEFDWLHRGYRGLSIEKMGRLGYMQNPFGLGTAWSLPDHRINGTGRADIGLIPIQYFQGS